MNYVLDTHTHTVASGHAYCTIREMAKAASEKGLELLGITEHGPMMPGSCHEFYFSNIRVVDRELYGVELLFGVELNILDYNGRVDMEDRLLRKMDLNIASLHTPCAAPGTREKNTAAYINAMKNPCIDIIGHPDDRRYPIDYESLVRAARERHVALEVNESSLRPGNSRVDAKEFDVEMLKYCRQYNVPVVVGSDAHFDTDVGNHSFAEALFRETDFPEELILNRSVEALKEFANKYKNR